MMKLLYKKHKLIGNKGFSLVELIIVIAIMAVLMAVLAPQLIKYVEKSRVQADETAASEILNAVKVATADSTIYSELTTLDKVTWDGAAGTITATTTVEQAKTDLEKELATIITPKKATSNKYKAGSYVITITIPADGNPTIAGTW